METTAFDDYVGTLEREHQKRINRAMNAEIAYRLRTRTEEEALAALLSVTLFPVRDVSGGAFSDMFALSL